MQFCFIYYFFQDYIKENLNVDVFVEGNSYIIEGLNDGSMGDVVCNGKTITEEQWKICSEDLCVLQLGGMDAVTAGEIVMGQTKKIYINSSGSYVRIERICPKCEYLYGRHSFAPGVIFASDF